MYKGKNIKIVDSVRFNYLLHKKGVKKKELAEKLNIKPDSLNRKLSGVNKFYLEEVIEIIKILKMSFEQIFLEKDD